ncbi:MAG: ABC transporter ATP-binding protein [Chrysiogenetes bacterium]|nr:ABC transporter ATP-binding protein [Chrysiogenetes bacterium]
MSDAAAVSARGLSLRYPGGTLALDGVDFSLAPGEFVAVLGPSGCGKSTLLRIAAGLESPTDGTVEIAGDARTAFVFQDPTLLPWRTVTANVGLPLELQGRADSEAVGAALELVGLSEFAGSYPRELSGGMRMRVSLARALVGAPRLLLLDEPFGALDDITRRRLGEELLAIWQREGWSALFVTHNVAEAAFLARRVLVMSERPGRIRASIEIPFDYPRGAELRAAPEFARVCGELSRALEDAR